MYLFLSNVNKILGSKNISSYIPEEDLKKINISEILKWPQMVYPSYIMVTFRGGSLWVLHVCTTPMNLLPSRYYIFY